jgi:hypothetical protein
MQVFPGPIRLDNTLIADNRLEAVTESSMRTTRWGTDHCHWFKLFGG